MAIKIPSKNIYEMENHLIRDNVIDNVSVNMTIVSPNNEYEVSVYNKEFSNVFSIGSKQEDKNSKVDGYGYIAHIAFVEAIPKYANISEIKIPILKNNNYISKIYVGKNEDNQPNIKFSLIGDINKGTAYKKYVGLTSYDTIYNPPTSIEKDKRYELPSTTIEETINDGSGLYVATAKVIINDLSNILTISYKQENDYYVFKDLKIISGLKFAKLKKSVQFTNPDNWGEYQLEGTYEEYIPTNIEITIYGNTLGINLTDGSIPYGSGKKPFALEGNELLQDSATTYGKPTTEYLAENILNQYAKGKETITLLCDINEYYDEQDNLVISAKDKDLPMTFDIGDIIIPKVFGANGQDEDMSKNQDGTSKQFRVCGTSKFYDGAVFQKLYAQEI